MSLSSHSHLRALRFTRLGVIRSRQYSSGKPTPKVHPDKIEKLSSEGTDSGDFRPQWFFSAANILTYTTIPRTSRKLSPLQVYIDSNPLVVGLYCVFLADWGDRGEHVFMPVCYSMRLHSLEAHAKYCLKKPRRWLERQKASFFSLSPAEEQLAKSEKPTAS